MKTSIILSLLVMVSVIPLAYADIEITHYDKFPLKQQELTISIETCNECDKKDPIPYKTFQILVLDDTFNIVDEIVSETNRHGERVVPIQIDHKYSEGLHYILAMSGKTVEIVQVWVQERKY